jgi:hypothetical protein
MLSEDASAQGPAFNLRERPRRCARHRRANIDSFGARWPRVDISLYGEIAWRAQLGFTDLVMKLIAHRGWSAGPGENSLAAFARAARDGRISGVEFDVCLAADSDTLVVSHDPPRHVENAPTLDAALSLLSPTDLELFVEVKETGLVSRVIERLVANNVAHRSVVFAFAPLPPSQDPFRGRVRDRCAWASSLNTRGT